MTPYTFMTNSLIEFDEKLEIDDVSNIVKVDETGRTSLSYDITSISREKITKLKSFVTLIDSNWIKEKQIPNNMTLEKVSYDLYKTTKYWDLLLLLNERMPIWDMPYDFDIISDAGNTAIEEFETEFYGKRVSERKMWDGLSTRDRIVNSYQDKTSKENNKWSTVKYVDPDHIYDLINLMYQEGIL